MTTLHEKHCEPCSAGTPPLSEDEISILKKDIPEWDVIENKKIQKDFKTALDFVNMVGAIAEDEGHHPDIFLSWGKVKITLLTHKIQGLSTNDFILAAKIDSIAV